MGLGTESRAHDAVGCSDEQGAEEKVNEEGDGERV